MSPACILLAEDNNGDIRLIRHALASQPFEYELLVLQDGEEILAYINHLGTPGAPFPDLILLDLNLPKISGRELLRELRSRPGGSTVPVVVLTSSDAPRDRTSMEALGVSCYFRKPMELDEFMKLGAIVEQLLAAGQTAVRVGSQ